MKGGGCYLYSQNETRATLQCSKWRYLRFTAMYSAMFVCHTLFKRLCSPSQHISQLFRLILIGPPHAHAHTHIAFYGATSPIHLLIGLGSASVNTPVAIRSRHHAVDCIAPVIINACQKIDVSVKQRVWFRTQPLETTFDRWLHGTCFTPTPNQR